MRICNQQFGFVIAAMTVTGIASMSASDANAASVRGSLSSTEAYVGMPVTLHIEIGNAAQHQPPTVPSIDGLDVRSSGAASRSSQTTIINGRRSERSSVTYAWQLTPRRAGTFVIPPVEVNVNGRVEMTRSMRFSAEKSETGDLMFVEVDGQAEKIYVGQPLKLTLRIWIKPYHDERYDITLSESDMWQLVAGEQSNWGAFTERMTELSQRRQRIRGREVSRAGSDGHSHTYYRYDIDATIYPKRPGLVDAGDVQVVAKYPTGLARSRSFFSMGDLAISGVRPIVSDASVAPIDVTAIPDQGRPADYRGAVGEYQIVTQATPTRVKAGDPITLHIGIRGDGPMALVQAPPLAELPELTGDFKVPEEALAGHVKDDVKVFSVSIRPRREGISQIPALPFTYFDPTEEEFVTVRSAPIAIEVDAADQLSLSAIIGNASADHSNSGDEEQALALANFTGQSVLASSSRSRVRTWAPWLIIPPSLFFVAWLARRRDAIVARVSGTRVAARRRAIRKVNEAHTPHGVAVAVLEYAADLSDLPSVSLTRAEAVRHLQQRDASDCADKVDQLLATCEASCYAGQTAVDVESLKRGASQCVARMDQVLGRRATTRGIRAAWTRQTRRASMTAGSLIVAAVTLGSSGVLQAGELSSEQSSQVLAEATSAYELARVANEPAEAKEAFSAAAKKYQTLVDAGTDNGQLYFNLGNAYLQSGDAPRALANYQRAAELMPGNRNVERNRTHAQDLLGVSSAPPSGVVSRVGSWVLGVTPATLAATAIVAWALLWSALIGRMFTQRAAWRPVAIVACVVLVASSGAIAWQRAHMPTADRVMIVAESTVMRDGNGHEFAAAAESPLTVGGQYQLVEQRAEWLRIRLDDGQQGWVSADEAELLPARRWQG